MIVFVKVGTLARFVGATNANKQGQASRLVDVVAQYRLRVSGHFFNFVSGFMFSIFLFGVHTCKDRTYMYTLSRENSFNLSTLFVADLASNLKIKSLGKFFC
jgi:hypothetical protein